MTLWVPFQNALPSYDFEDRSLCEITSLTLGNGVVYTGAGAAAGVGFALAANIVSDQNYAISDYLWTGFKYGGMTSVGLSALTIANLYFTEILGQVTNPYIYLPEGLWGTSLWYLLKLSLPGLYTLVAACE